MTETPLLLQMCVPVHVHLWAPMATLTAVCARGAPDLASANAVEVRVRNDSQGVFGNVVVGGKSTDIK